MSKIREEDGSNDRGPEASRGGAVAGDREGPEPQRGRSGDEQQEQQQQQQEKQKGKGKKKRIFRRAGTLLGSSIKRIGSSRKSNNSSPFCPSSNSYPFYFGDQPIGCCYLCFLSPPAADSQPGPGGPSGNTSSYGFVKNLIESNDFYDPECNVHRDI